MSTDWHPTQAIGPDGRRADIKNVGNGLRCGCVCFECKQPVLAKQGSQLRWHFAHYAPTNCRPTPESELHFFAKCLLADELWLWIPPVRAYGGNREKQISKRRKFSFSDVRVEMADGNVRPDLILVETGGRALHVEIFVRHRVDRAKLAKLKARGISSVEIDLSHLNWDDRTGWKAAILETAPREWLHNAKAATVERELEAQAQIEAELQRKIVEREFRKVAATWKEALASYDNPDEHLVAQHDLAMQRGFSALIGRIGNGDPGFRVPAAYWQSAIVNRFLWDGVAGPLRLFETEDGFAHVRDWVRPGLNRVSQEAAARMRQDFPEFQTPWHVVHGYLKWLKNQWWFDKRVAGKQWLPSSSAIHHREEQEAAWQLDRKRKEDIAEWADFILSNIPENESSGFDRVKWADRFVALYDEDEARRLCEAVYEMVVGGERLAEDLLGLPLSAEFVRQDIAQTERQAEKERKRIADMEKTLRDGRISKLQAKAADVLDSEAREWLQTANERLNGIAPLDAAAGSEAGLALADAELKSIENERREAAAQAACDIRRKAALEKNRAKLDSLAKSRARDPVRASLWCQTPNPKLGGQRPIDYCSDDHALRICKEIMPASI